MRARSASSSVGRLAHARSQCARFVGLPASTELLGFRGRSDSVNTIRRVSAKQDAQDWAETVRKYGEKHELRYEPIGGINPKDGPVALCVGGTNRLTGQLDE